MEETSTSALTMTLAVLCAPAAAAVRSPAIRMQAAVTGDGFVISEP
jgi:hypothetical protein